MEILCGCNTGTDEYYYLLLSVCKVSCVVACNSHMKDLCTQEYTNLDFVIIFLRCLYLNRSVHMCSCAFLLLCLV